MKWEDDEDFIFLESKLVLVKRKTWRLNESDILS